MNRHHSSNKIINVTQTNRFRSTFNHSQISDRLTLPTFQHYLKGFPLNIEEDIIQILKIIEPLQNDFGSNLQSLKLYKPQLSYLFQQNWCTFLNYLKTIIIRMSKRTDKSIVQKQSKITSLLNTIKQLQLQKIDLKNKFDKLVNLRQMQSAQLQMSNNELQIVNKQMRNIYSILQSDVSQVMQYLTTLQRKRQRQDQSISNEMNQSLNNLSILLDSVQRQQNQTNSTLSTMKQMIKAMTKSTKISTGTQVDQSQLQTNVGQIFNKQPSISLALQVAQGMSVNVSSLSNKPNTLIEQLKLKQKQTSHEIYDPKKSVDKPWCLTPILLVFLQNMSKQNEIGRVLPWQYVKQIMNDIYEQRIIMQFQMSTAFVGNMMNFDEFVVFYYMRKYKIRRLAEVKLLEIIISLKYYAKFWSKAEVFCYMLDVMKYIPLSDVNAETNYKFDYYAQHFYFSIYKQLKKFKFHNEDDGSVFIEVVNIRKLIKVGLFFSDQFQKSRILSRLQKNIRIFKEKQYCDLDYAILLIFDEYFNVRKKNNQSITKTFSKAYQKNKGYFSITEITEVFDCLDNLYRKCQDSTQLFAPQSQLYIGKLYVFSITSGKNNYEIQLNNFLSSVHKFGFDSPYPFIKVPSRKKSAKSGDDFDEESVDNKETPSNNNLSQPSPSKQPIKIQNPGLSDKNVPASNVSLNTTRVDVGSKLFSQHFSILKQLFDYVKIFQQTLKTQKNADILWKSFNQIKVVLERGCTFLKYPLVKQMIK